MLGSRLDHEPANTYTPFPDNNSCGPLFWGARTVELSLLTSLIHIRAVCCCYLTGKISDKVFAAINFEKLVYLEPCMLPEVAFPKGIGFSIS